MYTSEQHSLLHQLTKQLLSNNKSENVTKEVSQLKEVLRFHEYQYYVLINYHPHL